MNVSKLEAKLLAAAKRNPPDQTVPYAFEQRIMANLGPLPSNAFWLVCGNTLWRAAFSCMAVTALCAFWYFSDIQRIEKESFSQSFESAVYATVNQPVEDVW